jgi:beta-glucan synthesis-associated protein KRE6
MHTFRLEWQPGEKGYVHWYVDNVFKFGIEGEGLKDMESMIPNEPSYIILNTAISTSWGFPNPPWGCTLYDCKDPDGQCGFNAGFCKSLPAHFKIDYVRVYQNKNDKTQTIGCNPRGYPTKKFIAGHEYRYKLKLDPHPILPIQVGGGKCSSDSACGDGTCHFSRCRCDPDWTGPHCLVPTYQNDFPDWEEETWITLSAPYVPSFLAIAAVSVVASLVLAALYVSRQRKALIHDVGSPNWL